VNYVTKYRHTYFGSAHQMKTDILLSYIAQISFSQLKNTIVIWRFWKVWIVWWMV